MREWSDQLLDSQHCVPLHLHMAKSPHEEPDRRVTVEIPSPPASSGAMGAWVSGGGRAIAWRGRGFPSKAGQSGVSIPPGRKQEDQASGPTRETTGEF